MNFNSFFDSTTKGAEPAYSRKGFIALLMLNTRDGSQLIFSGDMDSIENPDRSLERFIADSGNNFKMILGEKRSNLATPLYPILENASLSIQYYFFCLRSTLAVMPINGMQMISSQSFRP
jgi:hypothetical protein